MWAWAIEVKASSNVGASDLRGFTSFSEVYKKPHKKLVLCIGGARRKIGDVSIMPWHDGFDLIFKKSAP